MLIQMQKKNILSVRSKILNVSTSIFVSPEQPGAVEVLPGAMEARPGAVEAHPRAIVLTPGSVDALA